MPDGSFRAQSIHKVGPSDEGGGSEDGERSGEFTGRVAQIDSHTDMEGPPKVGDRVQVEIFTRSNSDLLAVKIEKQVSESDGEGSSTRRATTDPECQEGCGLSDAIWERDRDAHL